MTHFFFEKSAITKSVIPHKPRSDTLTKFRITFYTTI